VCTGIVSPLLESAIHHLSAIQPPQTTPIAHSLCILNVHSELTILLLLAICGVCTLWYARRIFVRLHSSVEVYILCMCTAHALLQSVGTSAIVYCCRASALSCTARPPWVVERVSQALELVVMPHVLRLTGLRVQLASARRVLTALA
jgi:hypothetical protein